jgi:hypothetical protein
MCEMKSKDSRIDPLGAPCFIVPHSEKKFENHYMILFQHFVYCWIGSKPICTFLECHKNVIYLVRFCNL